MWSKIRQLLYTLRYATRFDDDIFVKPMRFGKSQKIMFMVVAFVTFCRGWSNSSLVYSRTYHYYCPNAEDYFDDPEECQKNCLASHGFDPDTDFEVICDKDLVALSILISVLASFVGGLLMGVLTDTCGRKRVLNISCLGVVLCSVTAVLAPSELVYLIAIGLRLVFINGSMIAGFVLISEIVGRNKLGIMITIIFFFMDLGTISLIITAYSVRHWRTIELFLSVISVFLLGSSCLVSETPRWYFSRNNVTMATKTLKTLILKNKLSTAGVEERLTKAWCEYRSRPKSKEGFFDLFYYTRLREIFFIFAALQFIISIIFDVGHINFPLFKEYLFPYAILSNVFVSIGRVVFSLVLRRLPNKEVLFIALIFNCGGELLIAILSIFDAGAFTWGIVLIEGLTWATVNPVMVTYYVELFPTNIRGKVYGVFLIVDIVGLIIASFVSKLHQRCSWLPPAINFIISFAAICISTNLPQIPRYPLPQCSRDAEFAARGLNPANPLYAINVQKKL